MGSSSIASPESLPSPEFLAVFRAHADIAGCMTFARFMELALYHPEVGYYRKSRPRVGYAPGTDFFTASTSGAVFGELVVAACTTLLRAAGRTPEAHTFIEVGAENDGGILAGIEHPFASTRVLRIGEPLAVSGECVMFSNELFDAQPCTRTIRRDGGWREIGVQLRENQFLEIELPFPDTKPDCPEGYYLDRPLAATALAEQLAAPPWRGLFLALDYGKTWQQLVTETPAGTTRAYYRHTQSNDLLARPGEQDLTCHVCWDWLEDALRRHGFAAPRLESQEAFFIRHAGEAIAAISAAEAARFSQRKNALLQLLHPAHLGQKFQVLHALR